MTHSQSKEQSSTVVMDQSPMQQDGEDDTSQTDLAKLLAQKIARKLEIPQLMLSLNISLMQVESLKQNFKTLTGLEVKVSNLVKELF
jgi:hypothetical protein